MKGIRILGTGSYLPPLVVDNDDMSRIVDTSDEWIRERTGIGSRHVAAGETAAFMGAEASRKALDMAGVTAGQLDMIIGATLSADENCPCMAAQVQGILGNEGAVCFDVNCACTGFVCALDVAAHFLAAGTAKRILVVSSEMLTRLVDFTDRASCVLFGDGAGAAVIASGEGEMYSWLANYSDTKGVLRCPAGRSPNPFVPGQERGVPRGYLAMEGKEVYRFATTVLPRSIQEVCRKAGVSLEDVAWIVPHQANIRIIQSAMKHLHFPMERVFTNIETTANTSSASIPIALDGLVRGKGIRPEDWIVLSGFGAGLSCGAMIFRWN